MSEFDKSVKKIIKEIEDHFQDENDKEFVLEKLNELSECYSKVIEEFDKKTKNQAKKVEEVEKKQEDLEKRYNTINKTLNLITKDIYEDSGYDFEIVCPYCNHEFTADVDEELSEEVECPKCHNKIELDWNDDDNCSGNCDGCAGCSSDNDDDM